MKASDLALSSANLSHDTNLRTQFDSEGYISIENLAKHDFIRGLNIEDMDLAKYTLQNPAIAFTGAGSRCRLRLENGWGRWFDENQKEERGKDEGQAQYQYPDEIAEEDLEDGTQCICVGITNESDTPDEYFCEQCQPIEKYTTGLYKHRQHLSLEIPHEARTKTPPMMEEAKLVESLKHYDFSWPYSSKLRNSHSTRR